MTLTITIERTDNGFILRGEEEVRVYEESGNCKADVDVEAVRNLLYGVVEMLGVSGSRYDAKRISITLEPGDKYEDPADSDERS